MLALAMVRARARARARARVLGSGYELLWHRSISVIHFRRYPIPVRYRQFVCEFNYFLEVLAGKLSLDLGKKSHEKELCLKFRGRIHS